MKKLFLDTNILIDSLLDRRPFSIHSKVIFQLAETNRVQLFSSSVSMVNTHYTVSKQWNQYRATNAINALRELVSVLSVDQVAIDLSLDNWPDFEDAVQYHSACKHCDVIITRDKSGFKPFDFPVMTPKEFLETL